VKLSGWLLFKGLYPDCSGNLNFESPGSVIGMVTIHKYSS
jgi:hypothetical protein